jgi:hypothetical protein
MNTNTTVNLSNPLTKLRRLPLRLWLQHLNAAVLKRSLLLSVIIGSILTLVTQSAALFSDTVLERLPLMLAFVTPFIVITISQLVATHQAVSDAIDDQISAINTSFITTLIDHNIPFRALVIGLIIGSTTSLLILISTVYQTGDISNAPLSLLAQVYVLPVVFGALSQTLTYRRYTASSTI